MKLTAFTELSLGILYIIFLSNWMEGSIWYGCKLKQYKNFQHLLLDFNTYNNGSSILSVLR